MESFSHTWDFSGNTVSNFGNFTGKVQLDAVLDSEHHNVKVVFNKPFVEKQVDRHWRKLAKNVTYKGFRRGKATKSMVEQLSGMGADGLYCGIFHSLLDYKLKECSPRKVMMITAHHDQKQEDGSWMVEAMAFLEPDVEVKCALDKIVLTVPKLPTVDEVVEHRIADAIKTHPFLRTKEDANHDPAPAAPGDMSEVKIEAFVDEQRYPDACEEATRIRVVEDYMPAGLYKNLVGAKAGDVFTIETDQVGRFTELAGKVMKLDVRVLRVYTCEDPEVDDDLAVSANFKSLEEMKTALSADARKFITARDLNNKRQTLINYIVAGTTIGTLPDMWLNATMQSYVRERHINHFNPETLKASIVQDTLQYLSFKMVGTMLNIKWDDADKDMYEREADKYVEKVLQHLMAQTEFVYADIAPAQVNSGDQNGTVLQQTP